MPHTASRLAARLSGAAAACGLALAGLVVVASPASAAACSGSSGVTVVVDRGGSISTRCAYGDPSSAVGALQAAGFSVDYPQQFPGSVVCRINGYPSSDPCMRMPSAKAYWAFFHAKRGSSWVYSSSGVASYDPAPGSVVGFRFGSGQQPGIAPPAATKTSTPTPTKPAPKPTPKPPTTKPKPAPTAPKATSGSSSSTPAGKNAPTASAKGTAPGTTAAPSGTPSASPTASASASTSTTGTPTARPSETASDIAAAPTSLDANDGGSGPGTLLAGAALVVLVASGAGWAAWRRRS